MDRMGEESLPPRGIRETLRQLGPGLIISGSIVGSGELIATTTLGAQVGFIALWLILLSCLIKVVVQQELGRYTIATGDTTFQALDKVPGPRWRTSWVVWAWMFMFVAVTFQQGGIVGGVGQAFNLAFPQLSAQTWTIIMAASILVMLLRGKYSYIEKTTVLMVVSFTLITIACAIMIGWTPYRIEWTDFVDGLRFQLPVGGLAVAFAAFGITGVGATELIYYPYWCLEKGYARYVGKVDDSAAWVERARGWIGVMQTDTLVAMLLYTLATVAFYALGASVLFTMGEVPAGYDMVRTLSLMYIETLGPWAFYLFLLGAFFVLYSTNFSATASNSRVLVDFLELIRVLRIQSEAHRLRKHRLMIAILVPLYTIWYILVGQPVLMVIIGGTAQACLLPIIGFSTVYLRYKHIDPRITPGLIVDLLLWGSSTAMLAFASYRLVTLL